MTHPDIEANERARRVLRLKATRDALRVERSCDHSVIVYEEGQAGEYLGPHPTICICLNCRMEYHCRWHEDPKRSETLERRFVEPSVAGVKRVMSLRVNDARSIITPDRYDAHPPIRKPRKNKA